MKIYYKFSFIHINMIFQYFLVTCFLFFGSSKTVLGEEYYENTDDEEDEDYENTEEEEDENMPQNDNFPTKIIIGKGTFPRDMNKYVNLAYIDSTTGRKTAIIFKFPYVIMCTIKVKSPSGKVYDSLITSNTNQFYTVDTVKNIITFNIPNIAEVGPWVAQYSSRLPDEDLTYMVVTHGRESTTSSINIVGGLTQNRLDNPTYQTRVVISAKVISQSRPVLGASVQGIIEPPSGQTIYLTMVDNGVGCDSKADDGNYSASLIGADISVKGIYNTEAKVYFTQTNAGKEEKIVRFVTLGSLEVINPITDRNDKFPPDLIRNVQVQITNKTKRQVQLEWKAVGNDGDRGKASTYEIMAKTRTGQTVAFENVVPLPLPGNPGQQQTTIVQISGSLSHIKLLLRATDSAGNTGQWSEVVVTFETPAFDVSQIGDVLSDKKYSNLTNMAANVPQMAADLPKMAADLPKMAANLHKMAADLPNKAADLPKMAANLHKMAADLPNKAADLHKMAADLQNKAADLPKMAADLHKMATDLHKKNAGVTAGPIAAIIIVFLVSIDAIVVVFI